MNLIVKTTNYHRKSIRLKDYDYSQAGAYFVTICTNDKGCAFGEINDGEMHLNDIGKIVESEWMKTGEIRKNVLIDEFFVMPNHLHGIIIIIDMDNGRGMARHAPTRPRTFGKPIANSLSSIIGSFKSAATKHINQLRNSPGNPVWQRNYFERIIRNEKEWNRIREYIISNPFNWVINNENPQNWN